jgi:hypothetical protein
MQKALTLMNIQLHHVISDISGLTGLSIVRAIVDGERDPKQLAKLRDPRIRASKEIIEKSLQGHWQEELLFDLKMALQMTGPSPPPVKPSTPCQAPLGSPKSMKIANFTTY